MLITIKNFILKIWYALILIYLLIFVPSFCGHKPLVVISGSMEPILKVGGILYYHEQDLSDFKTGDILVYSTKTNIISHRIVERTENGFITKGDANSSYDSNEVLNKQVLGKGTDWSIPFLGYYASYIYTHKYLLFISVFVIIIDVLNDTYMEHKKKVGQSNEEDK